MNEAVFSRWLKEFKRDGIVGKIAVSSKGKKLIKKIKLLPAPIQESSKEDVKPWNPRKEIITQAEVDKIRKELTLVKELLRHYMENE